MALCKTVYRVWPKIQQLIFTKLIGKHFLKGNTEKNFILENRARVAQK
jgi:hypothetical protein